MIKVNLADKFNKLLLAIGGSLFLLILVLGWLNENQLPYVQNVGVRGGAETADFVGQQITLYFSRPMDPDSFVDQVTISPQVELKQYWNFSNLVLIPQQTLEPDTKYTLTVSSQIKDIYGERLASDFNYDFTTIPRKLAYISRGAEQDSIVVTDLSMQQNEELFSAANIRLFGINRTHLAVVNATSTGSSRLSVVNLANKQTEVIEEGDVRISALSTSSALPKMLYSIQPIKEYNGIAVPTATHIVKVYDFETRQTTQLQPAFEVGDYVDVRFTRDGLGVMFRDEQGVYYLMDLGQPELNISLGKHIAVSDFDYDSSRVIVLDQPIGPSYLTFPSVALFTKDRDQDPLYDGEEFVIDPVFLPTQNAVLLAKLHKDFPGSKGIFKIVRLDLETRAEQVLLTDNENSLELPRISIDGAYAIIERYTKEDLVNYTGLRNIEFQTKPAGANLIILNLATKEVIDSNVRGVNAVWIE